MNRRILFEDKGKNMGWLETFKHNNFSDSLNIEENHQKKAVLVVDDDEQIVDTISRFLKSENYDIITANSAIDGLEKFKLYQPGIIITDVVMPGMTGIELLKEIKRIDSNSEIIVLTGHSDMQSAVNALKNNASEYLIKPVDFDVLKHAVEKAEKHQKLKIDLRNYTLELEKLLKDIKNSREYLESIIQNSPNATITYDKKGKILSWNEEAEKITGYSAPEVVGKRLKDIFVLENQLIKFNGSSIEKEKNILGQILTKDQQHKYIVRNSNALLDQDNNIIGGIESFYDITEKTENDRLLEKRYLQVQTINEIGKKVAGSLNLNELLDFICSILVKTFFESAQISVLLKDKRSRKLRLESTKGQKTSVVIKTNPIGCGFSAEKDVYGYAFSKGEKIEYNNIKECPYYKQSLLNDLKSIHIFPIKFNQLKYGILSIENVETFNLDISDKFMLETISEYIAISLQRNELLNKIKSQNNLLETRAHDLKAALKKVESQKEIIENQNQKLITDLKKASDFQKSLLPTTFPDIEKYKFSVSYNPSNQLGGDFYDIFKINENKIGLIITDASGHGVSSAMLSAMFKMTLAKYALQITEPNLLFERMNKDFCNVLQTGDFFTAFYSIIDFNENNMVYSNAGHPKPIVFNYINSKFEELDSEGFLLGVMDKNICYEKKEIQFAGKHRIFFYTDGLSEAINKKNTPFGEQRIKKIIKKYQQENGPLFLNKMVRELKNFSGNYDFDDDLTLISLDIDL